MHHFVASRLPEIENLCRTLPVRRLDLFGSASDDSFDTDTSDVDVLVEFDPSEGLDYFDTYFGLMEGLERILGRSVDLVSATSIRNPYFTRRVLGTREPLYLA
ncbi:hypothetical protein BAY61_03400 [Prauserella marina]|uniref:Uncharacterized protein n=1 Tax=Prauserella marina TaxID=530584 RepID=A0A222VJW4_9PSEU|nr:nucleotidyltransferase domain-containing protein [Prauserella marina]ASR34197.1 hypothetical protein BAY61_03400 [Prauserella marina]PWV70874.1 hypothetical protein DES30_11410 [Prauserella marina]SDE01958.1 hypothetical protein SAMN05421630_11732 [Prauserella marina]